MAMEVVYRGMNEHARCGSDSLVNMGANPVSWFVGPVVVWYDARDQPVRYAETTTTVGQRKAHRRKNRTQDC